MKKGVNENMGRKKRILIILITVLLMMFSVLGATVNAVTVIPKSEQDKYKAGDTVKVIVALDDVDNEIYGVSGVIEYDTNVFEEVVADEKGNTNSIKALSEEGEVRYNEANKMFLMLTTTPITEGKDIIEVDLKVKEGVSAEEANIEIKNVVASDAQDDIEIEGVTKKIKIEKVSNATPEKSPTPTSEPAQETPAPTTAPENTPKATETPQTTEIPNTPTPEQTPNELKQTPAAQKQEEPTQMQTPSQEVVKNSAKDSKATVNIPYAGLKRVILPILIVIAGIIAVVKYIRYKKIKNV